MALHQLIAFFITPNMTEFKTSQKLSINALIVTHAWCDKVII